MSLPIYQRVAVTDAGDVIPGAEYTVVNENTGVAAPIYSDRTGATLLTAPYFADSAGTIQFFIAQGTTFRVAASGGVGTYTDRYIYAAHPQSSATDTTAGSLMAVGAFGLGTSTGPSITNLDTIAVSGFYAYTNGATGAPIGDVGTVFHQAGVSAVSGSLRWTQFAISKSSGKSYTRTNDGGTILPWNEVITANAAGNVGIRTDSPDADIHVVPAEADINNPFSGIRVSRTPSLKTSQYGNMSFANGALSLTSTVSGSGGQIKFLTSNNGTSASETARIDAAGNLLVGTTDANPASGNVAGSRLSASNSQFSADSTTPVYVNRKTTDGTIIDLRKDGTTVGSVGIKSYGFEINGESGHTGISFDSSAWVPLNSGSRSNDSVDLGTSNYRFDDVYATNGTISTSDRNEKQDILEITEAEAAVAKACKGLLRSFRWKAAVKKSEDARVHFGIMAQDLQGAFTAEGLDAGRYGMFISSTWWEAQTEVAAVEAVEGVEFVQAVEASEALYSEDGELVSEAVEAVEGVEGVEAVEAKDAYTRTDTFQTLAEAPTGATERTRLGVRYSELLAFIIAAL